MYRILVTGGLGFIGRTLINKLLHLGNIEYLHIVDNLSNSMYPITDPLRQEPLVSVTISAVDNFEPNYPYTEIYHLASPVGPAGVLGYAGRMAPMIIQDTAKMAQLALRNNARLIDISTSEVYGKDPGETAQKEDIAKTVPSDVSIRLEYGTAKLVSEICLLNLRKVNPKLQFNIIRPFNVVGVGQRGEVGFVIPRFMEAALENKPLTIFGDGEQKRTFTSVKDLCDGIIQIMRSDIAGEIFNIGNPNNICSINQLADKIVRLTNTQSDKVKVDPKTIFGEFYAEAWNKIPDITKIKTMLGWQPQLSLDTIDIPICSIRYSNRGSE